MEKEKPYYWKSGKLRKNYDGDPDWDWAGSTGLKRMKAFHALADYEQKGEPVYDKQGFYDGQAVNLAHHTELKKNAEANRKNDIIAREKTMKAYQEKHPKTDRYYMNVQMSDARDYAAKWDNKMKAHAYTDGYYGYSDSKDRENKARRKKEK